jgi:hypothetical protein
MRTWWVASVVLCMAALAACDSGKTSAANNRSTLSSTTTTTARRTLDAVLDDAGLHLPAGPIEAADYRVAFVDKRSHPPADQRVALRLSVSGPDITVLEVPPGEMREGVILANVTAAVEIDGKHANVPIDHPLDVVVSKEYRVPAT